jgi:hypothetical protein
VGFFVVVCGTPTVYFFVQPLMPAFATTPVVCRLAAALLVCVVEMAGSVIEVLAIYFETKAKGPMTEILLGMTMLTDMVVLVLFAVSCNIVLMTCPLSGAAVQIGPAILSVFISIALWLICGVLLSGVLLCYLYLPEFGVGLKTLLIITTAYGVYVGLLNLNVLIPTMTVEWGTINIDPLIVCMVAAGIVNNLTSKRQRFAQALHSLTPWIMPAFFTVVGATLNLNAIRQSILIVPLLFGLRLISTGLGTNAATRNMCLDDNICNHLWMCVQPQSGVTIGLLAQMKTGAISQQPWSANVVAVITGGVVINQILGNAMCRFGIRHAGESHEDDDAEDKISKVRSDLHRMAKRVTKSTSFILPPDDDSGESQ